MSGNTPAHRLVAGALAMAITAVCAGMAGLSAVERATNPTDKAALTGLAVALVIASHLLPALSRKSWFVRAVFTACVVVTLYNHAYFFDGVKHRAGQERATLVVATSHTMALQSELDSISARPVSAVAADLATATARAANAQAVLARCEAATPSRCTSAQVSITATAAKVDALKTEATESARAADIRTQLASAAASHDTARTGASVDPVDAQIANMTGLSVGTVGMLSAAAQSLLLEIVGAVLWAVALPVAAGAAQQVAAPVPVRGTDRASTGTAPTAKPIASAVNLPKSLALLPSAGIRWRGSIPRLINAMHRFKVKTARHLSAIVRYPKMPACGTNPAL